MSSDLELLDGAIPLVRQDHPWEWYVSFYDDAAGTDPTDLTGKTASAEIRWASGRQTVTAGIHNAAAGQVRLLLSAAQTTAMPLGRLSKLYVALDTDTEVAVPVNVLEGLFPVGAAGTPVDGVLIVTGSVVLPDTTSGLVLVQHGAAITITLPAAPALGQPLTIKDALGTAGTNPVTITGGAVLIDGAATLTLAVNWSWVALAYMGGYWGQV